jgi:protein O-mannosyl-transferase
MRRPALISLLLIGLTWAAYWPVHQAGFINFDDPEYVTANPEVFHGLTWHGVVWAFTHVHASNWHPLTWLSHMADCSLFGGNAAGPHLVNVGFHLANTLLLLLFLWRMTGAVWRSGFVAALFALHPLHVESVAWISERKDVLSTFFGLLTLLAYLRYFEPSKLQPAALASAKGGQSPRSKVWYGLALLGFALGLLSKPMLVTLPFVLLLLDFWPLGRFQPLCGQTRWLRCRQLVLEKLPFFALSAAASTVTFWAQKTTGAVATMEIIPLANRLANAAVAYVSYLDKAFWPTKLAVFYPFVLDLPAVKVATAVMCLLGATALSFIAARRAPYVLVGWLWFVGTLVPVIGLVQVGGQAMADRYTYLPLIGIFVMVSWGAVDLTTTWRYQRLALPALAAVTLTGCLLCTRWQVGHWRDSLALFSHAVAVTKNNAMAEQRLGYTLALSGNLGEATRHFDVALRLCPTYEDALLNRGHTLLLQGRVEDAIADYRGAIRTQPAFNEKAYYQLAGALVQQKKWNEAKTNYLLALGCKPDSAEAHTKLGELLWRLGDHAGARSHLDEAVRIRPDYVDGQYALGNELAQQQRFAEAAVHLRAAIKAQPNYAPALNDLAWILATQEEPAIRNVPEAIRLAQRACQLTQDKNPGLLATLGVAQSEAGQFPEALRSTEQALALAAAVDDQQTMTGLRRRLDFFRKGQAYSSIPR